MIMSDKKKPSALIIAKMRGPAESAESVESPEVDDSMAKETAAEELLKAIESKSPKAIAEAFSSMMELCSDYSSESED